MAVLSHIEKFVSLDAGTSYTFGLNQMAIRVAQNVRTPMAAAIGADFAHDFSGAGVGARDVETIGLQWFIVQATSALVDSEIDACRSKLLLIGKGKLYALFADATERWCYARIAGVPAPAMQTGQIRHAPISVSFIRLSNWHGTAVASSQAISTQGIQSFTIANAGNAYVRDGVYRLRANAWHGFQNPVTIRNSTTNETLAIARDANFDTSEIKVDCAAGSVYYSDDDGATYADDYARVTRGSQGGMLSLAPGNNTIVVCSGNLHELSFMSNPLPQNASFEWSFDNQYI